MVKTKSVFLFFFFRADIFVFLLSTRAGGLGINLTAADTVRNEFSLIVHVLSRFFFFSLNNSLFGSFL